MQNKAERDHGDDSFHNGENLDNPARKKRPGELLREGSLLSAPTIIIVYPLVGFGLGWLGKIYLGWPWWVPLLTMLAGLTQAIREIIKLAKKVYGDQSDG